MSRSHNIIINYTLNKSMAQIVKNITSIRYFLDKHNIVDNSYDINMNYHPKVPSKFTSNPTFVAEFNNCSVNSLPVLITEDRHLITEHLWPMLDRYKNKPNKLNKPNEPNIQASRSREH
mgnify:CR=1 FL=1